MSYLKQTFSLELKSLAVFRIAVAITLLLSLWPNVEGDIATFQEASLSNNSIFNGLSLLADSLGNGSPWLQYLLGILLVMASLRLLVGHQTTFTCFTCFCLCTLASLTELGHFPWLAPALLPPLLWSIFLPIGAAYSLDSATNITPHPLPNACVSGATIAWILQHCFNYWIPGSLFLPFSLYLGIPENIVPIAQILLIAGVIGTLLILLPIPGNINRYIAIALFVVLHTVGILSLGQPLLVALLAIGIWSAFLPRSFWQMWEKDIESDERKGLTIYYDADCGFCKKVVHVLRTVLILPGTPLLTAQSDDSICADMEAHNSWVVVDWTQKRHFKFEAIAYICSISPIFHGLMPLLRLSPIMTAGNRFYETIANNRRKAGLFTRFLKFESRSAQTPWLGNFIAIIFLTVYVVLHLYSLT